ncbi:E3 ubiquitin-protein ligase mind-bomb [Gryllus bimaculatus]|nr:E3 ubiquitin-protein ligase mind-bomb [Gryllus bimaculatus]
MDDFSVAENVISSPLCFAARQGKIDVLQHLLEKGHHVNLNDNRGWTPLHEAIANGHLDCVRLLFQQDECDVNACTFDGMTPMYVACQYQDSIELIKLLVEHGVSVNKGNTENITPLHVASKSYKLDVVKELVKNGAVVNVQDFNNFTPLMEAIDEVRSKWNQKNETPLEVIRFLLDNGANVNLTDLHGRSAFFIAVCVNWNECVQLLLEYGPDVNMRTNDNRTALFIAANKENLPLVKLLLNYGAVVDVICDDGTMPLHEAIHNGNVSVAEELMKKINVEEVIARNERELQSFLIFAIDSGSLECFKLVMDHKLYSYVDCLPFSVKDSPTLLNEISFKHYRYVSPLSFLLYHHLQERYAPPMLQCILDSGDFSVNAFTEDFMPPLVALIVGLSSDSKTIEKLQYFSKLLEMGADIDYNSVETHSEDLLVPDIVRAIIIPSKCNVQQSLLLPVLAHCFACNWDDLLDWLVKDQTCSAFVLSVLIKLGIRSKQSLLQIWDQIKHCSCNICEKELPNIHKLVCEYRETDVTLQSLCRVKVRNLLWEYTGRSKKAEDLLHKLCVPFPVKQFIIPEKL